MHCSQVKQQIFNNWRTANNSIYTASLAKNADKSNKGTTFLPWEGDWVGLLRGHSVCFLPQRVREKPQEHGTLGFSDWHGVFWSARGQEPMWWIGEGGEGCQSFPEENGETRRGTTTVGLEDNERDLEGEKRLLLYLLNIRNALKRVNTESTVLETPHTQSQPPVASFHLDTVYIQPA